MHSLSTPLQLPLPFSPLFSHRQSFLSPFISPYNGACDNHHNREHEGLEEEFSNFKLDAMEQFVAEEGKEEGEALVVQDTVSEDVAADASISVHVLPPIQVPVSFPVSVPVKTLVIPKVPIVTAPTPARKAARYTKNAEDDSDSESLPVHEDCETTQKIR